MDLVLELFWLLLLILALLSVPALAAWLAWVAVGAFWAPVAAGVLGSVLELWLLASNG